MKLIFEHAQYCMQVFAYVLVAVGEESLTTQLNSPEWDLLEQVRHEYKKMTLEI